MSTLTRRRGGGVPDDADNNAAPSIVKRLKKLDVLSKTESDFVERTNAGAVVSLVAFTIMAILSVYEVQSYIADLPTDSLSVDLTRDEHLRINLDITFPSLPCSEVSIDVMDVMGDPMLRVQSHIYKHRLHENGLAIDVNLERESHEDREKKLTRTKKSDESERCGDCHLPEIGNAEGGGGGGLDGGAVGDEGEGEDGQREGEVKPKKRCCNTCQEVKDAFAERGWSEEVAIETEQCRRERELNARMANDEREGCRIEGYLEVNKIAGNFHFAPGRTFVSNHGHHIHEFKPEQAARFNVTHTINHLSFGEKSVPGVANALDGTQRVCEEGPGVYQYFIKIIPTSFYGHKTQIDDSYQFAVTEHKKESGKGHFILPGVFFMYDLNPIRVTIRQERPPLGKFLTRLCAVVGGIFTVSGLTDSLIQKVLSGGSNRRRSTSAKSVLSM